MKIERRSTDKAVREIQPDEGIVDAYLTAWDTVDSYKTSFQRGSFAKTFENRAHKIRLLWNHGELAGKCLEAREDEYGAFVKVQFNLATEVGRTAFEHIKAQDVDAFSFGFNVVNDKWVDGIRTFTEVKCLECSPVMFPANEAAVITNVRDEMQQGNDQEYINDLQQAVREHITENIVSDTSLTLDEFNVLDGGRLLPVSSRSKLAELPEVIQVAHQQHRREAVKTLCDELREGGFTAAEKTRFIALLGIDTEPDEIDTTINFIRNFRKTL